MNKTTTLCFILGAIIAVSFSWEVRQPIPYRRSDHGCAIFSQKIYVSGGCASDQVFEANYSACATISDKLLAYSPETDAWEVLSDMPRIRYRHQSVASDGKVYLFGGVDNADSVIAAVDIYDIKSDTWSTLSSTFVEATSDLSAFQIDKKIILVGGYSINSGDYVARNLVHYFDIPTQTFQYNITTLNQARGDACVAVDGRKGYIYGGFQTDFCTATAYMEEFDFESTRSIQKASNFDTGDDSNRKGDVGCFFMDKKFYTVGGELNYQGKCIKDCSKDSDSYDPKTDTWKTEDALQMEEARFRFCTVSYGKTVYRIGGQGPLSGGVGDEYHSILDEVRAYDFSKSSSSTLAVSSLLFVFAIFAIFA